MKKKNLFSEHWKRSLVKAISYRCVKALLDFSVVLYFTKRVDIAAGFSIFLNLLTTLIYYGHERLWANIHWGKTKG